ncbi:type 4a pilus biogenesis protein PilO [Geomobilimonas luticola]|uniref:Type 4a pilus biogenesis protein PilO n=1 Tax=Geomobilimonas luticola TaxID=1114878 RepID=A0ABS5SBU2_9BACT|nr:type 4a pilus biogenesis protein PilO [Geomobilimonas luticola]MBT0652830.1 type 4a pilus biogenesis protein PilO [Geomobilimonas luticola]
MDPRVEKLLKLPNKQKAAILGLIVVLIGAGLFFGLIQPKLKQLKVLQGQLDGLHTQVTESRKIANNLPRFKAEYAQLNKELENALTELPNQKEIPTLLTSITSAGKGAGLDFLIFRPKPEEPKDFYSVVPVDISVSGSYASVGNFFVAVGNLPRIVNINNVAFTNPKNIGGKTVYTINCLATTFRFLDKKEIKDDKKGKK